MTKFLYLADVLKKVQAKQREGAGEEHPLQVALEGSKKAVIQGSMAILLVKFVLHYHKNSLLFIPVELVDSFSYSYFIHVS